MSHISVIIPLYNKANEIERTLQSVARQSVQPLEVIVVDDGSTDGSAEVVAAMDLPFVRLIRQRNGGVSAARNHAMKLAQGEWVALLDGDDYWQPEYLENVERMIELYPAAGAIGTSFFIDDGRQLIAGNTPEKEGVVDFFRESMTRYVLIPSATVVRRDLALAMGGFPDGMRMAEDQYLWTKIARTARVVFSPKRLVVYSRAAENRSASIYRAEQTTHSLEELYDENADYMSNEYIARVALGKALVESARGGTAVAQRALEFFSYNTLSAHLARKVRVLNALPAKIRPMVLAVYNWLAWVVARKGL
ncbi:MAG: glycosyltransferase family 2 protein [Alistipes sp.]|nr:glycosyltransferase family 2 protein [Alistipes sp.]